jgi:mannose-6-phosphate isomerase-like protein (cupin superfamily)
MSYKAINFRQKLGLFDERWAPKVIAEMNDYQLKIVKLQGDFIWHDHKDTDETFIVLEGDLRIDFRDGAVHVATGEMFVVPKGVEHKPYAENEVKLLLIEPRGAQHGARGRRAHGRERRLDLTVRSSRCPDPGRAAGGPPARSYRTPPTRERPPCGHRAGNDRASSSRWPRV